MEPCIACGGEAKFTSNKLAVCDEKCVVDVWNRVSDDTRKMMAEQRFNGPMDLAPLEVQELWQDLRDFKDSKHRFEQIVFNETLLRKYDGYVRFVDGHKIYRIQKLELEIGALRFGGPGPFNRFVDSMMLQSNELSKQYPSDDSVRQLVANYREDGVQFTETGVDVVVQQMSHFSWYHRLTYMKAPAVIDGKVYALVYFGEDGGNPTSIRQVRPTSREMFATMFKLTLGHPQFADFRMLRVGEVSYLDGQVYGPFSRYKEVISASEPNINMSWQLLRYLAYARSRRHHEPYVFSEESALYESIWQILISGLYENNPEQQPFVVQGVDLKNRVLDTDSHFNASHRQFVQRVLNQDIMLDIGFREFWLLLATIVNTPNRTTPRIFESVKRFYVRAWIQARLPQLKAQGGVVVQPKSSSQESSDEKSSEEESSDESSESEERFEPHNPKRVRVVEAKKALQ